MFVLCFSYIVATNYKVLWPSGLIRYLIPSKWVCFMSSPETNCRTWDRTWIWTLGPQFEKSIIYSCFYLQEWMNIYYNLGQSYWDTLSCIANIILNFRWEDNMKPCASFRCCAIGVSVDFEQQSYSKHWTGERGVSRYFIQDQNVCQLLSFHSFIYKVICILM